MDFLRVNSDRAFFTTEMVKVLSSKSVKQSDVMSNVRRWEKKGFVLVRGYRLDERQTPFKEGYIITWIDPEKPREEALKEAVERTDRALIETQNHRTEGMDKRRITLHLLKGVVGRRANAEVDRVWEVTPASLLHP